MQYVMSGGVRRAGERIRTVAELCEAETGGILWTERLEGSTNEVFALQDRLAERIVTTIAPHVRRAELQRALRKHPESLDAYDFMLRGLDLLYRLRREEFEQAYDMFQRAIELEPGYATPYALSANWYSIRIGQGWSVDLSEDMEASTVSPPQPCSAIPSIRALWPCAATFARSCSGTMTAPSSCSSAP